MLKIFNTAKNKKIDFIPINKNEVTMYVCGPTVYDYIHIGNARPIIVFDVLYRLLSSIYPSVKYVRNITDIDDKINSKALQNNETIFELTKRTENQFIKDYKDLNAIKPDIEPRATEHIDEMIEMIQQLIENKNAYEAKKHILFSIKSWDKYGKFANKNYDEQEHGARVEVADYKQDPADFVLWKPSSDDEPSWDSPWGKGRPGWHIECSAMVKKHLGENFDIHGGGLDLIFPHHQNEIAQSCCANKSDKFANYWMHNGFLMSEGQKMSKSLGNFYTINELLNEFSGNSIRLVLLSTHYRKPLDFTKSKLIEAENLINKFSDFINKNKNEKQDESIDEFKNALCDDLNTPLAISIMWKYQKEKQIGKLLKSIELLGFDIKNSDKSQIPKEIKELAEKRNQAKIEKSFTESDKIRNKIKQLGYEIKDTPDGYEINKI